MGKTIKKAKKKTPAQLRDQLWELTKQACRKKYGNVCFTCGSRDLAGSNWQSGHFIPSSVCGAYLRYDLRNIRPQCIRCNLHGGGMGAEFYRRLVLIEGQEYVDQLFRDKQLITKADSIFYLAKIKEFEGMDLSPTLSPVPREDISF